MERIDKLRVKDTLVAIDTRKRNVKKYREMARNNEKLLQIEYEYMVNLVTLNPDILRPMTPGDVVSGDIYILDGDFDSYYVGTIDEVIFPDDPWKAFCSDDGCRYGLSGCFVIKEEFR